jgi:hypothetical protein
MSGKSISPFVDVDQTGHYFGAVDINGGTSPTFDLDLSNTGTGSAKLTNFALGGMTPDQFSLDLSDCGGGPTVTLTGNSSCTAVITFAPDVADDAETLLTFDTDDLIHDSYSVEFDGYGSEQQLHSQNGNGFFVPRAVGSGSSAAETFTYDNPGSLVTSIDSVSLTGADASQFSISSDSCTPSLADGDECDIDVKFTPTSAGSKSVNLHVVYNHSLDSVDVPIDADAIQLELSSSTGSLAFNSQLANSGASAAQSIHLDNNGFLTTPVNSLTVTGADASSFAITSQDCTPSVAGGDSCAAQITFNPTSAGAKSASLHVVFDSPRGSLDVPISGTATSPSGSDPGSNPGGSAPTPRLFADGAPPAPLKKLTGFTFAVGCGTACKVSAAATVSFKAKVGKKFKSKKITATGTASPAAGATATLSLKFKPADIKLFKGGKSGSVKVTFTAPGMAPLTLPLKLK